MDYCKVFVAGVSAVVLASLPQVASAQVQEIMKYCKGDAERLCPGVEPGGGRIVKCLKTHEMEMSVGCAKTLQKVKAKMGQ